MQFAQIDGQIQAKRMLQNALRRRSLAHAYIFSGPPGTGRKRAAQALAQAVYCLNGTEEACGHCIECRKVGHGNHPDFHWVNPDGASIKIDQIRELQQRFAYRSAEARTKIYVLNEAEKMTVQAANSLLKFLEEPVSEVMAILITENGQALLPTIQSRAQWVSFVPLNPGDMARKLIGEGLPPALVRAAVHLASGLDAARELIQSNWFAETRNLVIQLAKETHSKLPSSLLTIQNKVMKSEANGHLPALLDLWVLWFKDLIQLRVERKEELVYIDQLETLTSLAYSSEIAAWVGCMERILEIRKRLRFHVNPQLGLENLAMSIHRMSSR